MKIIYISNSIIPSRTANSIHVMKMCQAFAENGHEVVLLAPNRKDEYEAEVNDLFEYYGVKENFKLKKLPHPSIRGGVYIYALFVFIYTLLNRAGLIYGRFLHGCYLASIAHPNVILESHAPIFENNNVQFKLFERLIKSKSFKKLVVISQALKQVYLDNGYLSDNQILVAHDGADKPKDLIIKAELKGNQSNVHVGYVGHLYQGKGVEVIADIAADLPSNVSVHIIGGLEKDIQYWQEKISHENIHFYGFIPQSEVWKYLNALDVCLLPNQKVVHSYGADHKGQNISDYTSPLKMFDYMAHGKAIISSDLPVLREVLNESCAVFAEADKPKQWLKAIERLSDLTEREALAKNAKDRFDFHYQWRQRARFLIMGEQD